MSSNKACCWILGILAGGFVLIALIIGWGISSAVSGGFQMKLASHDAIKPNSWLILKPSGTISDYNVEPDLGFFGGSGAASLHDMVRAIKLAEKDPDVPGIILRPMGVLGMASVRELREALLQFKQSDKPIYAHFDIASDRDYYLASVSDSIFMMPGRLSGINFGGMAFSSTYMKSMFEKVGIKFHVIHAGRYKSAFENFGRDSMSTELRQSISTLYSDVYDTYVRETAAARPGLSFEALDREIRSGDQFIVSAASCLSRGYVDAVVDWPVLRDRLKGDAEEFEGVTPRRYLASKKQSEFPSHETKIAVLYAQGEINFGEDDDHLTGEEITAAGLTKQLDQLTENEHVKAVVLRVDSPGGSALASKQILESARRLKDKKPVIVSMGRVAASGGYYISMAADKIVAQPNTITGSIGVVSMLPSGEELYHKIGAREETVSIGRWANFFRFDQTPSEEQLSVLRSLMDSVYLEFREDVALGRGIELAGLDSLAEGKVYTGNHALAVGLVDTLGGIDLAVSIAAGKAGLKADEYDLAYYPKEQDVFEFVVDRFLSQVQSLIETSNRFPALDNPQSVIDFLKSFYNRFEFLQSVLPVAIDA